MNKKNVLYSNIISAKTKINGQKYVKKQKRKNVNNITSGSIKKLAMCHKQKDKANPHINTVNRANEV